MSDNIEDDDDKMIVFVVEDENSKDDQLVQVPCPITIKIEPLDMLSEGKSGNEIFKSPNQTKDKENIKEEYVIEYLEEDNIKGENVEETEEYDVEYLEETPLESEIDDHEDDEDYSEQEKKKTKKITLRQRTPKGKIQKAKKQRRRRPQKKPQEKQAPQKKSDQKFISYVKYLRKEHPEMADNDQLLVEHLAGVMRETIPPEPPENYCKEIKDEELTKYECTLCGVQRDSRPMAARHYQFKHGEFYLTCYACGIKYRNTTNLYKHEKRCSAPDAKIALRARGHYLGRKGRGRPFITDNRFITAHTANLPSVMQKDYKTNHHDSRYFCSKCPASFVRRDILESHENSHEGVRPFRCTHCTVAYTNYPALKRHLMLHGEYRYICDHCGRKFKLKPALVSHLDTHRPVRKHGCLYCPRRFAQKTALRHHINKVHLNLPAAHGCPVCPKRYARLSHVKEHMDRVHGLTMITRKMYFQALPTMTDSEVTNTKKFFNFEVNEYPEPEHSDEETEHILPDVVEETIISPEETSQLQKYVNIIKKKKKPEDLNPETEETETKQEIPKEVPKKAQPKPSRPKRKRKLPQRKPKEETQIKVDEEIEGDICNIEYKRQKKTVTSGMEKKNTDDEMYKVVRDIKSTLTERKKVQTQAEKKRSTQNFDEIKREFMKELKNELEIPEHMEKKPENLAGRKSPEHLVPGTEIPENLATWTKKQENELPQKELDDEATDDEEWKVYKDVSEKNMVIADFLEYMKSGVVPKNVPILRRGRQTNKKTQKK